MTSVIGLDIGNMQSKIGLARNRGIDIITNETSNRATPSLISFGPKNRAIGESAKTQETSNWRNTIGSLKRIVGRTLNDIDIQQYEKRFITTELVDQNGSLGVQVQYLGERRTFTATQLYAMYLGKLRDIAQAESKAPVNNVVIAVPGWYCDVQRRAVLDAAEIAGLNALKLINEGTATAFGYGITKTDLPAPEERPRHVAFVDIGHSDYSVTIAAFNKTGVTIKAAAYDRHFGGRDLDYALVEHFAAEFRSKYKIDVMSNKKAVFRLTTAVERLKKILSANVSAPLNVESLMDDIDATSSLTREAFEALISQLLERTVAPLEVALSQCKLTVEDIDAIELIGGSTRVPALKQRIQDFFGKTPSVTTNQDEAVARGATLACATLSPVFRVREFSVTDVTSYPINIKWEKVPEDEDTHLEIFQSGNTFPSVKVLTLQRTSPFDLEAFYADTTSLPGSINPWLSKVTVKGVVPAADGSPSTVKVKTRMNQHGIFNFEGATLYEAANEAAQTAQEGMDVEGSSADAIKAKKTVNKKELHVVIGTTSLDRSLLNSLIEQEGQMHENDKLVADTEDRKNALEEYIYDMRDKLDATYASFATDAEKEQMRQLLENAENWLYSEEGESAHKSQYVARVDGLKAIGDPIARRFKEYEERPSAIKKLRESLIKFSGRAASSEDRFTHIAEDERQKAVERVALEEKWLNDQVAKQAERSKSDPPVFTSSEVLKRREELVYFCNSIFNKPKPAPKTAAPPPAEPKGAGTDTPAQQSEPSQPNGEGVKEEAEADKMDVD